MESSTPEIAQRDGRLILLLGGARAGKSAHALRLAREHAAESKGEVSFIATAQALDEEMAARIARHRAERPPHWLTIEEPYRLDEALRQAGACSVVIVDCLTLLVSNWLLASDSGLAEGELGLVIERALALAGAGGQTIICVSNEVGLGLVPETPLGRKFRDLLGGVNQRFAQAATEVHLLVAGLSLQLKPERGGDTQR